MFRYSENKTIVYSNGKLKRRLSASCLWLYRKSTNTRLVLQFGADDNSFRKLSISTTEKNSMSIICHIIGIIISPTVVTIILIWEILGLFELNSRMSPILFQPFVSYRLENIELRTRSSKNVEAMEILGIYSRDKPKIEELFTSERVSLGYRYYESLQKHIFPAFCNDFESQYAMFAYIFLKSKTSLVLLWRHRPTRPILGYSSVMVLILRTSKIHRKLKKIATTIIFSRWWSEKWGNL